MIDFFRAHVEWVLPSIFVLSFLKALAFVSLVVPTSVVVAAIGAMVGLSGVSLWPAWLMMTVGAGLGDWVSYGLGLHLKDRARLYWPFTRYPGLLPRGERFFRRWGALSVALCRFFSPLRATVPLLCGIFEMSPWVFQLANWLSAILWATIVLGIGLGVERLFR